MFHTQKWGSRKFCKRQERHGHREQPGLRVGIMPADGGDLFLHLHRDLLQAQAQCLHVAVVLLPLTAGEKLHLLLFGLPQLTPDHRLQFAQYRANNADLFLLAVLLSDLSRPEWLSYRQQGNNSDSRRHLQRISHNQPFRQRASGQSSIPDWGSF